MKITFYEYVSMGCTIQHYFCVQNVLSHRSTLPATILTIIILLGSRRICLMDAPTSEWILLAMQIEARKV